MAFRPLEPRWHPDPFDRHEHRFWDGTAWTSRVADNGIEDVDPAPATGAAPPAFRQPEEPVEPQPAPRPTEPVAAAGPFNFADHELDDEPPEAVDLDRLDGGGRKGSAILGALAVLAVLGLGAFLLFSRDDTEPAEVADLGEVPTTTGAVSTDFPTAAEQQIIDRLPGGFRCQRASASDAASAGEASVECSSVQSPPDAIVAHLFGDRSASEAFLDSAVAENGVAHVPASDCGGPNTGLWSGGDFSGRIVCFSSSDSASLAWTVGAEPVVNVASGADPSELFAWWQTSAVPGPVEILQPFPTSAEATSLAKLPASLAASCSRFIGEITEGASASFECRPASGADVVYIDTFADDFDVVAFYDAFDLPRADKGGCRVGVRGNNSYSIDGTDVGRVACYVKDGRTWVHWFDGATGVVGQANFADSDVTQPFTWWASEAVPGAVENRTFDRAEERVLKSVAAELEASCVAEPVNADNDRWSAKLRCAPGDEGVLAVTYFAFQTKRKANNEYAARQGDIETDSGNCVAGAVPSEGLWQAGARSGRQLCQVLDGVAQIFELDPDGKTAVLVVAENADIDLLASWLDTHR